ncbi:hypothetical protein [Actinoplanes aureus]|uniref:hypothetical protein n=1 Tax=Actinoplanes aureus TaxID=2792083 RepID=UPI001E56AF01|nr:hypothetical protein [Actinoplanes aureus]
MGALTTATGGATLLGAPSAALTANTAYVFGYFKNNSGSGWRLWGDSFSPVNNDYYAWSTSNVGANSWTLLNQRDYTPPLNAKHGSITGITAAEYDGLVARCASTRSARAPARAIGRTPPSGSRKRVTDTPGRCGGDVERRRRTAGHGAQGATTFQTVSLPNRAGVFQAAPPEPVDRQTSEL